MTRQVRRISHLDTALSAEQKVLQSMKIVLAELYGQRMEILNRISR